MAAMVLSVAASSALAQVGFGAVGGVYVDAEGMLRDAAKLSKEERLKLARTAASAPHHPASTSSPLRKVSLVRLEAAMAASRMQDVPRSDEMQHLAGLQQIRHLYFYPEANDVVIAGPAEGWRTDNEGNLVGGTSGRPVLDLDDLIVALRSAFSEGASGRILGCSIEPTDDGVRKHAEFMSRLKGLDRPQASRIVRGMEAAMGPQRVLIYGVPESSRFALEMIAADYRLKRLALAHDPSPSKKVPSFLDLASRSVRGGAQPQHRWWFVGTYDAILFTPDRLAWEFVGAGLRVETAPTTTGIVDAATLPKPSQAARQFAEGATRGIDELTEKIPAFARLQNLISLAAIAELIRQRAEEFPPPEPGDDHSNAEREETTALEAQKSSSWRPVGFLDPAVCPIDMLPVPKQTPSLANVRIVKDRYWLFSTSGGVEISPDDLVRGDIRQEVSDDRLQKLRTTGRPEPHIPAKRTLGGAELWWWD
jgi:hypothetical protein